MSEYKKVKLGDIFTLEKGSLQSSKCTPGQYDFITADVNEVLVEKGFPPIGGRK